MTNFSQILAGGRIDELVSSFGAQYRDSGQMKDVLRFFPPLLLPLV